MPLKVTVLVFGVNVPEFDQLPLTLRLVEPESSSVPEVIVTSPLIVELLPDKVSEEVLLFCVRSVTLEPITAEMVFVPVLVPELVMVPVLLTEFV